MQNNFPKFGCLCRGSYIQFLCISCGELHGVCGNLYVECNNKLKYFHVAVLWALISSCFSE